MLPVQNNDNPNQHPVQGAETKQSFLDSSQLSPSLLIFPSGASSPRFSPSTMMIQQEPQTQLHPQPPHLSFTSPAHHDEEDYDMILGLCMSNDSQDPVSNTNAINPTETEPEQSFQSNGILHALSTSIFDLHLVFLLEYQRQMRFDVSNNFLIAYNQNNFTQLFTLLYESCDMNVRFTVPKMSIECHGIIPILTFFLLLNEIYPDSSLQNIEKRLATLKPSSPPAFPIVNEPFTHYTNIGDRPVLVEIVENIDKFTGTRVFDQPVLTIFSELLVEGSLNSPFLLIPDIISLITKKLYEKKQLLHHQQRQAQGHHPAYSSHRYYPKPHLFSPPPPPHPPPPPPPPYYHHSPPAFPHIYPSKGILSQTPQQIPLQEKVFTFITESSFTFDLASNKIIQWSYSILASQSS